MNQTVQEVIAKLSQLSQKEREEALSAILDRFCAGCGAEGDFKQAVCDCPSHVEPCSTPLVEAGPKWPSFAFPDAKIDWTSPKRLY